MHLVSPSDENIALAVDILRKGGVVVHATETCYGLACDLSNPDAVAKLFALKKRSETQPISGLFPTIDEAKKWVTWNDRADELAAAHLPGPLTLILPLRPDAPAKLYPMPSGGLTLGVRVSSHPLAHHLSTLFGGVLSTSSANVHGEANPYDPALITVEADLILDSGVLPVVPPSTVVDLTGSGGILRSGNIKPM